MKYTITLLLVLSQLFVFAQKKHVTKTATISFEGSVDSFEPIEASNTNTTLVLDDDGNLAALVFIKGFRFPIALMQEHFNENYMESDDFPKATLRGSIVNFDTFIPDGTPQNLIFNGNLEMHGVKSKIEIPIKLTYTKSGYELQSSFDLNPKDFEIEIPSVVSNKISKKIKVKVSGVME